MRGLMGSELRVLAFVVDATVVLVAVLVVVMFVGFFGSLDDVGLPSPPLFPTTVPVVLNCEYFPDDLSNVALTREDRRWVRS